MSDPYEIKVRLIFPHPHAGDTGRFFIEDGLPESRILAGSRMWHIALDNCAHGHTHCFAISRELKVIDESKLRALYALAADSGKLKEG